MLLLIIMVVLVLVVVAVVIMVVVMVVVSDSGCGSDICSGRGSGSVVSAAAEAAVVNIVIPCDLLQFAWICTSCGNEGHNSKQQ